jgi:hypothetical protein
MKHADPLEKVRADVQKYGWHCLHVYPRQGEEGVGFTYTIGLNQSLQHADVAIFGLDREKSHRILSDCVETIRAGNAPPLNVPVADVVANDVKVVFKLARPDRLDRCFGTAIRYYADEPFDVVVMFWPNKSGKYPWDESSLAQNEGLGVVV